MIGMLSALLLVSVATWRLAQKPPAVSKPQAA
jgi:hypothetical protein